MPPWGWELELCRRGAASLATSSGQCLSSEQRAVMLEDLEVLEKRPAALGRQE
jgi:hypothetical protein